MYCTISSVRRNPSPIQKTGIQSKMKTHLWLGKIAPLAALILCAGLQAQETAAPRHAYVRVIVGKDLPGPVSGRLLVFAKNAAPDTGKKGEQASGSKKEVDISEFHPTNTSV